jgi:prevent-host-death family protein
VSDAATVLVFGSPDLDEVYDACAVVERGAIDRAHAHSSRRSATPGLAHGSGTAGLLVGVGQAHISLTERTTRTASADGGRRLAHCTEVCTVGEVSILVPSGRAISVTDAAARGVAGLVKDAEAGADIIVSRRGKPVAAVISMRQLEQLRSLEGDLRDAAMVIIRAATDTGRRSSLDDAIAAFGFSRAELEAELDADLAAGRE